MSKGMITVGSMITYPTVHNKVVNGRVEKIYDFTVMVRDKNKDTHLIMKTTIKKDGFLIDVNTPMYKVGYTKKKSK